ncbi:C-type lectin domain-containing protein [Caenorhabditis elegans]|uniref:C-type lectin domain-containing protein n=1 Tax=Caenorhabditis elegans TaxID=6239 RepID=Q9XV06_CAEEL|nr:C-type lectin domain-containing protein [Caenorhabditis elegans]CAB04438.2 C-type lectin domain-containing protein [Caenorhabditis elegans]|eukprot:NP_001343584.1 C-type LECtin [Caenorhabditis elegans]
MSLVFIIYFFLFFTISLMNACIPTQQVETTSAAPTTMTAIVTTTSTVSPTTTTTITTTTTTPIPCPTDWLGFARPSGPWCIRVFVASGDQPTADSLCSSEGAVLSSIQSQEELDYMANSFIALNGASSAFWIGAERTAACMSSGLTATCTRLNSFSWTDGSATGTAGFVWNGIEPNNGAGMTESCVVENYMALLSDQQCTRVFPGYACGKAS